MSKYCCNRFLIFARHSTLRHIIPPYFGQKKSRHTAVPGLNFLIGIGSVGDQVVSLSIIRVNSMILRTEEGDPSRLEMTLVEISTLDSMIMLSRLVSLG